MDSVKKEIEISTNDLIVKALEISAKIHKHQVRKGSDIPYVIHPVEVAMILQKNGASEEVMAAALLHDVLEDAEIGFSAVLDLMEKSFGEKAHQIIEIIKGASEELENRKNTPWKLRKQHTIDYLIKENTPLEIKMVSCADKLSNMRSFVRDYRVVGDEIWKKFNAGYEEQKWYYQSLVKSLESLEVYEMYQEFKKLVDDFFKE